jgi:hypothetical protein
MTRTTITKIIPTDFSPDDPSERVYRIHYSHPYQNSHAGFRPNFISAKDEFDAYRQASAKLRRLEEETT